MPRRPRIRKRSIMPDPVFTHEGVAKFVNVVMQRGKRSTAERIVYGSLDRIKRNTKKDPIEVFDTALKNATPVLEVKPRRIGGATYQVPVEIRPDRRLALARRWIVRYARARSGKSMQEKLAGELMDAANGVGATIKRREETHKMAESNKAFSHFRY
ncbi:MAG TPA: 30S ribosomal protein S7 [Candidatus Dormibacteraeota bacterium]